MRSHSPFEKRLRVLLSVHRKTSSNRGGQISVMISVMMSTFILLFVFVVNTGMLVNAKINLQNAADLAAYAGAGVQARQLTHISYLNYEMRRQWKKFLFRIYVLGNMSKDSFPKSGGTGPMSYIQVDPGSGVTTNYRVPVTCVAIGSSSDNYCRLISLPKISIPPPAPLDGINETLREQLQQIEAIRQSNCTGIAFTNKILNYYWLYNADHTMERATRAIASVPKIIPNVSRILVGLVQGIGIVPREIILKFRIETLQTYVNQAPIQGLNYDRVQGLLNSTDPPSKERSIQAFLSAYYTLGNHTFPSDQVFMDELQSPTQLVLNELSSKFDTWAIDMEVTPNPDGADCMARQVPVSIPQQLTLGVSKDPKALTYYAVRLRGKAKILFSPFGDVDLTAYSAARPFGSRIGPSDASFSYAATLPQASAASTYSGQMPNLPVNKGETAGTGAGWDTKDVLGAMYQALGIGVAGGSISNVITQDMLNRAYSFAMAPNPWEANQYNIFNDFENNDSFIKNFDSNEQAAIWAPIFPPDERARDSRKIQAAVRGLFAPSTSLGTSSAGIFSALQDSISDSLENYISNTLTQPGGGENGETQMVAILSNPFKTPVISGRSENVRSASGISIDTSNPLNYKTSWSQANRSDLRTQGRVGYSVKFVSFDSLIHQKTDTDLGGNQPQNRLNSDTSTDNDLNPTRH